MTTTVTGLPCLNYGGQSRGVRYLVFGIAKGASVFGICVLVMARPGFASPVAAEERLQKPETIWESLILAEKDKDYLSRIQSRVLCAEAGDLDCEEEIVILVATMLDDKNALGKGNVTHEDLIFLARHSLRSRQIGLGFAREVLLTLYFEGLYGFPHDEVIAKCFSGVQIKGAKVTIADCEAMEMKRHGIVPVGRIPKWIKLELRVTGLR